MSPELDTLDQLLGGDLSLKAILSIFPNADAFRTGAMSLATCGDASLLMADDDPVPGWRFRDLFIEGSVMERLESMKLRITTQGDSANRFILGSLVSGQVKRRSRA